MIDLRAILFVIASLLGSGCATAPDESPTHSGDARVRISTGDRIARTALDLVGTPYRYGGTTRDGFDCSGLVQYVHDHVGIAVPRTSRAQFQGGVPVDELVTGDILFFRIGGKVSHSGIYIGNGRFVHAPSSGKQVSVAQTDNPYFSKRLIGARRFH
ncbi:MAG: NlpC/P60 family protein [Gammaproteobacteria bacterium]|nr:NlpC/P60 family protein [Gammaproteobacteria bacterium]